MAKVEVQSTWGHTEYVDILKAYEGHYTAEFTFRGKRFYLVGDYKGKDATDIKIYTESEFLLADEPEAMYMVLNDREKGRLPNGMFSVVYEAMKLGREKADSGIAYFRMGW